MRKGIVILLLSCLLLALLPVAQATERELEISTAEELLEFAENCRLDSYSLHLQVSLQADIDLSDTDFDGIPLFRGTFYGNGYTVSGFSMTAEGAASGFFRYLTAEAQVRDLQLDGEILAEEKAWEIGGLAGYNAGAVYSCNFRGTVSGSDSVGGLVGINAITGLIENSTAEGSIIANHFAGGIAGQNYGTIRACAGKANINARPEDNKVSLSDLTVESLIGTEAAYVASDLGGIAGISSGVIRNCENYGAVGYAHMGYNIGGIAGTQSGYIIQCRNYGAISGRKEVGGIVGQMEPAALLSFDEDTLQILREQLGAMSALTSQATEKAFSNADQLSGRIDQLQGQAQNAKDAVESLVPDLEDPQLPDPDTVLAAQNTLAANLQSMPQTLRGIVSSAESMLGSLAGDLQEISGQMEQIGQTALSAEDNLGGSLRDVSDLDAEDQYSGKLDRCSNFGPVSADLNVGGIAGAMAVENDLDIWEDWQTAGSSSLNYDCQLRAVVRNCENYASVSGRHQNVGGIVGWQSMGLVRDCLNMGSPDANTAAYVGGIAGQSSGYIRACYTRCSLEGKAYIGGIAGSAFTVTDCFSQVSLQKTGEKRGAILGEQSEAENSAVSGNFYLHLAGDPGAIDGISYDGLAQPLAEKDFFAAEALPEAFSSVTLSFAYPDGTVETVSVPTGSSLDPAAIPVLPAVEGSLGQWNGPDLTAGQYFDGSFTAVYTVIPRVVESEQKGATGRPLALAEGDFTAPGWVQVEPCEVVPVGDDTLLAAWKVSTSPETHSLRLWIEDSDAELKLLQVEGDRSVSVPYRREGSYLVFSCEEPELLLLLVAEEDSPLYWLIAAGGAVLLTVCLILIVRKLRKKKKAALKQP